ncbi:hypothetical protein SLEP1_g56996 [Rubroshorea leprosula]|uniref:Uncharacterized protein n=1 Tax=Rubroshorea leprosula TaxID=152421 RepID=A0AAV5MN52_9ROSI|nr:hypothetical protein SLEP1_g56996 [Rubroshorea leprosula]
MWILGNPVKIEGTGSINKRAIYVGNHASSVVIFLLLWLTPTGQQAYWHCKDRG